MNQPELAKMFSLIANRDPAAAGMVRTMAHRLLALADRLEARAENPMRSPGGMGDRVQMKVVGPDGELKQQTDTGD